MPRASEDDLIARYLAPLAGPGGLGLRDDAALATPPLGRDLVVTKDMLVAGVHFFADDPPDAIARKALRVNLSDLAAKGAEPFGFLLGLGLPSDWTEDWLAGFVAGLGADSRAFGCPVLGGDTVAIPSSDRPGPLTLSITAFGTVPAGCMVPRTGVQVGDRIYVSGTIGDAVLGLHIRWCRPEDRAWIGALTPEHRDALLARHVRPEPRLALADALRAHARCAMDVSDGLVGDLAKMLRLERVGACFADGDVPLSAAVRAAAALEPRLLVRALTGGDDYEIVCCVPSNQATDFERAAAKGGVQVAALASVAEGLDGVMVRNADGQPLSIDAASFSHF